jgi:pimeloyl-ACP methyl ester carboxylesterase
LIKPASAPLNLPRTIATRARLVTCVAFLLLAFGCAPQRQSTLPAEFTALPGFRSWMIPDPEFGGQVFMFEAGRPEGTPVLLLHGVGNSGVEDYLLALPALADKHHIVGIDLPGFGRSTHANLLYSPRRYVRFLRDAVRPRLAQPFDLAGHSLGATLALMYAGYHPGDVRRLVLIDAAAILHRDAYAEFEVDAGLQQMPRVFRPSVDLARTMAAMIAEPLVDAAPDFRTVLGSDFARATLLNSPGRIAALAYMTENFGPPIERVRAPTLVVWGAEDKVAPLRTGTLLRARLPGSRLAVIPGAGHDPLHSHAQEVARLMLEHLGAAQPEAVEHAALPEQPSKRVGRCEGQDNVKFEGRYEQLSIVRCRNVLLERVQAERLLIRGSDVVIERSALFASATAATVHDSRVVMTATDIEADVALEVSESDLDLAGVHLRGRTAAIRTHRPTRVTFSVSRVFSPRASGHVHGTRHLARGASM